MPFSAKGSLHGNFSSPESHSAAADIHFIVMAESRDIFYHGYDNYMKHAFPEDELRPISCKPLSRDMNNPAHFELNDVLGNYSLTLIDSLSTLAILASSPQTPKGKNKALEDFQKGVASVVKQYGDGTDQLSGQGLRARGFEIDSKVQVFETVIRGLGGLLSAHLFAVGDLPIRGYNPPDEEKRAAKASLKARERKGIRGIKWRRNFTYDGQLLRLAHDLGRRLLPAFHTPTGMPYPRVNLKHGIPFYPNSAFNHDAEHGQCGTTQQPSTEITETCSAGAGSLMLEFTTLSRLTGDERFERFARRAFWAVWNRRSSVGLIGSGIDAESGLWVGPYTGIGAGIDSFFEYALKSHVLLSGLTTPNATLPGVLDSARGPDDVFRPLGVDDHSGEAFLQTWQDAHAAIKRHIYRGPMYQHPHYIQADLFTGAVRAFWIDSLSAYYPGLLTLAGELEEAIETHLFATALWTRYSALPERWSTATGSIEGGLGWWGGRPEFIESTYYLYRATQDPWYLYVGEMVLRDIKRRCWTKCGWAGLQDVRNGEQNDRMESFFLGETAKYLFLLFDPSHPLNSLDAPFVFTTEGHPLIIPRPASNRKAVINRPASGTSANEVVNDAICPRAPSILPLSISATAARNDLFHAASLARLHLMPTTETLESPIVEFSNDHPSISLSDVRSPSNYTYFPWTLPPELIPSYAISSKAAARPTFDITFPVLPNMVLGPGTLQRVRDGIMVNSMGGLRLGMIQDTPSFGDSQGIVNLYRVQAINNIALGKDEKIFMDKDVVAGVVSTLDPNFSRIRDTTMLDIVIDHEESGNLHEGLAEELSMNVTGSPVITPSVDLTISTAAASNMRVAFNSLISHVSSMLREQPSAHVPKSNRAYIPAITPTGTGAAPIPDFEEAPSPDASGGATGPLVWQSVYFGDEMCNGRLAQSVPNDYQIIVVKRGGCSFSQKLQNIPSFAPSTTSLQMVIVVSYGDDDSMPTGWLVRPLLDQAQCTLGGLPRHNPIPMVMVGGGEQTYEMLRHATGVGVKRRYSMQAQGIPISNLIIV
ncbi:MAG: alpha mannosidase-like protein [Pleopsidium flavum]|nr:MAG: alpha mannosidase-like protein [Pleopsidium flavum]